MAEKRNKNVSSIVTRAQHAKISSQTTKKAFALPPHNPKIVKPSHVLKPGEHRNDGIIVRRIPTGSHKLAPELLFSDHKAVLEAKLVALNVYASSVPEAFQAYNWVHHAGKLYSVSLPSSKVIALAAQLEVEKIESASH